MLDAADADVLVDHYIIESFGLSDIGRVRRCNQDAWGAVAEHSFYVLADGMGGQQGGEIAAQKAVDELCSWVRRQSAQLALNATSSDVVAILKEGISRINASIYAFSRSHKRWHGMGTTLCCLYFWKEDIIYAHIGDSRIYRLRFAKLQQLTEDDSLLSELLSVGVLQGVEARTFPLKHVLTKSLGSHPSVEPTIQVQRLQTGDSYLLCSDGLLAHLTDEELFLLWHASGPLSEKARKLVEMAKAKGGADNITAVLLHVK